MAHPMATPATAPAGTPLECAEDLLVVVGLEVGVTPLVIVGPAVNPPLPTVVGALPPAEVTTVAAWSDCRTPIDPVVGKVNVLTVPHAEPMLTVRKATLAGGNVATSVYATSPAGTATLLMPFMEIAVATREVNDVMAAGSPGPQAPGATIKSGSRI
jgi:hypothetical protein